MDAGRMRQGKRLIIQSARLAASQIFEPGFRGVLWKSLGLTLLLLTLAWIGLEAAISTWLVPYLQSWPWLATAVLWLTGTGFVIGLGFLIGPVAAIFAGVFLDDVAELVEQRHYPQDAPGRPMPLLPSMILAVKFTLVVIAANLLALALVLLPGINFTIFFFVNAWLIGREYFQFAAMRFRPEAEAGAMRRTNSFTVFMAGLVIAGLMAVPILNLLTPLFATAMMVHMHKQIALRDAQRARRTPSRQAAG